MLDWGCKWTRMIFDKSQTHWTINHIMHYDMELSKNDVTYFLRFLTPPSPLLLILLNRLMEQCHPLADHPPPKWVTSFMDDPYVSTNVITYYYIPR